jgi:hypothetical protein
MKYVKLILLSIILMLGAVTTNYSVQAAKSSDTDSASSSSSSATAGGNDITMGGDKSANTPSSSTDNPTDAKTSEQPTTSPIVPALSTTKVKTTPDFNCHFHPNDDRCAPDSDGNCPPGFAHNSKGNCHPMGPCPNGFGRHDDDESGKCFPNDHRRHDNNHNTKTIVIHKTVRHSDIAGIATVFVPGLGLVSPFNCKLNQVNNKIGCEYLIVNAIN